MIFAVAENDFRLGMGEGLCHGGNPKGTGGAAVGVGEEEDGVAGGTDAGGEGALFVAVSGEVDNAEAVGVKVLEVLEQLGGAVGGGVVNDNDFEDGMVLIEQDIYKL